MNTLLTQASLKASVIDSTVEEPQRARVFLLLAKHSHGHISFEQQKQEHFNCEFILRYFRDGDTIWVEESAKTPLSRLKLSQIPYLEIKGAKVGGWDHPEVCSEAEALSKRVQKLSMTDRHRETKNFILNTFSKRQQWLFDRIDLYVRENRGQLFVLLGEIRGTKEDSPSSSSITAECLAFRDKLRAKNIPFTMLGYCEPKEVSTPVSSILDWLRGCL